MRHFRVVSFFLPAILANGCDSSISDIARPTYGWGELVVDVKVNGDPAASSRPFVLHVNGEYEPIMLNRRHVTSLQPGDYGISIEPVDYEWFDVGMPSWCLVPKDNVNVVHIGKDSTTTVTLQIECPPFTGDARIRIHGVATGSNAPAEVTYRLQRIHPTNAWPAISVRLPVGGVQELNGEPGIYLIVPTEQPEKCESWWGDFFGDGALISNPAGYVLVRDGQVLDVNNALNCP